jgi:hypothetical protein
MNTTKKIFSLICACTPLLTAYAEGPSIAPPEGTFAAEEPHQLIVNNRILAKVNGIVISVVDVMKKMDLFLNQNYPHLAHSVMARYQFYSNQWKNTLNQMIDTELMMADAEHLDLKVTEAEVREEILTRFGPNVMASLDQINISYEDARKMIYAEMVVQRMQWYRVSSKALQKVHPQDIKIAYRDFCTKNPSLEEWIYQVLSIRSEKPTVGEELVNRAFEFLKNHGVEFAAMADTLKKEAAEDPSITVAASPEYRANEKTISTSHRQALTSLAIGSYSEPIAQKSRVDGSTVHRIFYLKNRLCTPTPSFTKMADNLREELIQKAFTQENEQYISRLRERLGYDKTQMLEDLPSDFQPFILK